MWGSGRSVAEISRKVGAGERNVEKVLEAAGARWSISEEQTESMRGEDLYG